MSHFILNIIHRGYVCLYVMLILPDALRQAFRCSSTTPRSGRQYLLLFCFKIQPAITLSTNNRITHYIYYMQLSATLREQLRTIVDNVMRLFSIVHSYVIYEGKASLHVNVTASITSQSREILTGRTKYQGIAGYF